MVALSSILRSCIHNYESYPRKSWVMHTRRMTRNMCIQMSLTIEGKFDGLFHEKLDCQYIYYD